jgi:heme oxygenase
MLLTTETAASHQRMHGLPFFGALQDGTLPKVPIVSFLRCLAIVHAVFERQLARIPNREVRTLTSPKLQLLIADMVTLESQTLPSVAPAIRHAICFGGEILSQGEDPLWLAGLLYVLEGSQNGALALRHAYARSLNILPEELSYFGCYGAATKEKRTSFIDRLESIVETQQEVNMVVSSAVHCFQLFEGICAELYPFSESDLAHHATSINAEAGDHMVPQDPIEIDLALRAGKAAWDRFPYLDIRFGERGRRFISSDSCWLLALTRLPVESVTKSLTWLRSVLAPRGIPALLLEQHLRQISEALILEFKSEGVERSRRYEPFLALLKAEQRSLDQELNGFIELSDRKLEACDGLTVRSAAYLIVSAWLDERAGIVGALSATNLWFADPSRFSPDWISNVSELTSTLIGHR